MVADQSDAALIIVGEELLSGATADLNGPHIAGRLRELGVALREIRIVGDQAEVVAETVRAARQRRWVFVIGGLGPTHDDVTAEGLALAFDVPLEEHPDAIAALREYHATSAIPPGRLPGARLPHGCRVLPDLISGAAGFAIGNVIALPGTPSIAAHLFELAAAELPKGVSPRVVALRVPLLESELVPGLRKLQEQHTSVQVGSYPNFGSDVAGVTILLCSTNNAALAACEADARALVSEVCGKEWLAQRLCR